MHLLNQQILGIVRGSHPHMERHMRNSAFTRRIVVGLAGGLAGTIAMHLFGVGIFLAMGQPASLSFTIIGDAAASFFSRLGVEMAGGAPLGVVVFYLIGLVFGVLLAALVSGTDAFRMDSIKKGVGLGILFVEAMSLPMLVMATLLLQMPASAAALWFGISAVMHLVYGGVLGAVVSYGLRPAAKNAS